MSWVGNEWVIFGTQPCTQFRSVWPSGSEARSCETVGIRHIEDASDGSRVQLWNLAYSWHVRLHLHHLALQPGPWYLHASLTGSKRAKKRWYSSFDLSHITSLLSKHTSACVSCILLPNWIVKKRKRIVPLTKPALIASANTRRLCLGLNFGRCIDPDEPNQCIEHRNVFTHFQHSAWWLPYGRDEEPQITVS